MQASLYKCFFISADVSFVKIKSNPIDTVIYLQHPDGPVFAVQTAIPNTLASMKQKLSSPYTAINTVWNSAF